MMEWSKKKWNEKKKKKNEKCLSWKPEGATQSIKNLDELKTQKGGSIWERMISLKWVEIRSGDSERNDSVWKVEMGDWKGEVGK